MHIRYLPPPAAKALKFAAETMPASPTNRRRVSCQSRRSRLARATVVTSTVLPGNTQCRTGKPSRVTAKPTTICGASLRPFLDSPCLRGALYGFRPAATRAMHDVLCVVAAIGLVDFEVQRRGVVEQHLHAQVQQIGHAVEDLSLDGLLVGLHEVHRPVQVLQG